MNEQDKNLTEAEIDELVIAQANDDDAWEDSIEVNPAPPATIALSSELAARAAFFARLHKQKDWQDWLKHVIEERIEFEEAAFAELKRELAVKN